jgi:hypothetical protein
MISQYHQADEHLTSDDEVFKSISKIYSFNHLDMKKNNYSCVYENFTDGITNGGLKI